MAKHFIEHIIDEDLTSGLTPSSLRFRFPPEPNGYLHIGHVKAICLNFELGKTYNAPVWIFTEDDLKKIETEGVYEYKDGGAVNKMVNDVDIFS